MKPNQTDNRRAYDAHKEREKHCSRWLRSLHKPARGPLSLSVLAGFVHGLLIIAQSALLAFVLHQLIIERNSWTSLSEAFGFLAATIALRGVCAYFSQVCGFEAAARIKRLLRAQLLTHFAELGPAFIKRQHSGQLAASTLEQCEALEKYFSRYVPQQTIAVIVPLAIMLAVFPVNWVVGLIFLLTGPLVPVFMALIGMGAASASRDQFREMAWMGGYFLDRLQGLTTLKIFGRAGTEQENIDRVADGFRRKTMKVLRIAFMSSAVLEFFSAVAVALVAVYVGLGLLGLIHFGPASDITLQEALFALLLAPEFFQPLRQLAANYHDRAAALGAADEILQILEVSAASAIATPAQNDAGGCLRLIDVSKRYGDRTVLRHVDMDIPIGHKVALVGESGAGKTTLFNLLMGFEEASAGQVLIDGATVTRERAAQRIGWLGQRAAIFQGSITDNIRLFDTDVSRSEIETAARSAGVMQFVETLSQGLDTQIGEQGYGLSGGQAQRIALARALLKNAPILLLDEPSAGLDRDTKLALWDSIEKLFADKTVLVATHDPDIVSRMQRTLQLKDGVLQ